MFKSVYKKIIWVFLIIVVLFTAITLLGYFSPNINKYFVQRKEQKLLKELEKQQKDLLEAYKNDNYGGKTPEETFDMFLDALKNSDIELASKYYELNVRQKALDGLREELQKERNLEKSIKYFSDVRGGEKKCQNIETKLGGCTFEYIYITTEDKESLIIGTNYKIFIPKGSKDRKITDFELNQYTKVWKITQP